ncbi:hypothetical protein ACFIUX_02750 [Oenococcus oeni]|uniref:hypothetical protein n=1 Tax=Oenococcus oeni TaxID=1247 RepID=UPI00050E740C|nr:hypothetical protein [Oenococcus oeni]AWT48050.1 hypothetical protein phiOE33PA_00490 [Oenococcus phage phiOE33PA]KGH66808.1 hypothetical protein X291_02220 [Oenococcus oeni IOEB_C23]
MDRKETEVMFGSIPYLTKKEEKFLEEHYIPDILKQFDNGAHDLDFEKIVEASVVGYEVEK